MVSIKTLTGSILHHPDRYCSTIIGRMVHWLREAHSLYELKRIQWYKKVDLERIQLKRLKSLLGYAYNNVSFYHRLLDDVGIKPADIKTIDDLSRLPIISKKDLKRNFPHNMLAKGVDPKKCTRHKTSGTTGERMTFFFDQKSKAFNRAVSLYPFLECGLKLRDKMAEITYRDPPQREDWFNRLGFMTRKRISIRWPLKEQINALQECNPDAIYGYPSCISIIAKALVGDDTKKVHPRLIFSHGETLDNSTRNFINRTFGVEMYDTYGCAEAPRLAWECNEHVGQHICVTSAIIEFIDMKTGEHIAPGEFGEIVITNLYNYAMPLIRYKLGDIGIPMAETCPCGRNLPLIKSIEGRSDDFIIKPNGEVISPRVLGTAIWNQPTIGKYKIIQERYDEFTMELVKEKGFTEETIDIIKTEIEKIMEFPIKLEIKIVEDIPAEASGKYRKIMSKVPFPRL
jgi:phenylacetate-CoA ligase